MLETGRARKVTLLSHQESWMIEMIGIQVGFLLQVDNAWIYSHLRSKIFYQIEPIMQTIKRIMHQSRYNDGEVLSADDQSFVLDNVFNYHPDKAVKMGNGVDYVMVSKHGSFQD